MKKAVAEQERDLMEYEVINYFTDLQDFDHPYHVGDKFPRDGMKVSEERLKELSGSYNKQHKPLIKAVEDETQEFSDDDIILETQKEETEEKQYTKSEINRMSTADLQELAFNNGFENAYEMTGGELKKTLIEYFGL